MDSEDAILFYAGDHLHLLASDVIDGVPWPVTGRDHVEAAVEFVRLLMVGRVEVDVRETAFSRRTTLRIAGDRDDSDVKTKSADMGLNPFRNRVAPYVLKYDFGCADNE